MAMCKPKAWKGAKNLDRNLKILISVLLVFSTLFSMSAARIADDRKVIPAGNSVYSSDSETDFSSEESTEIEPSSEESEPVSNEILDNPEYIPDEEEREDDPINQRPPKPPTPPPDNTIDIDTPPPPTEKEESTAPPPTESESESKPAPPTESETESQPPSTETEPPEEYEDGWHVINGKTYLYQGGKPVTGWQQISGLKYYFDESGVLSSKVGIDVSYAQGENIDWAKVKASGVDYVMIRVGYRGYTKGGIFLDTSFEQNIKGATAAGLDCGIYFFSQAITREEAIEEAEFALKAVKGFRLTYPIAFDTEYISDPAARTHGLTDAQRTDFAVAFCERILKEGYFPTIYASKSWLLDEMEFGRINGKYHIWLAHYINQTNFPHKYEMWQYSDSGKINGISSVYVDLNVSLFDYPEFMKKNGYNKL